MAIKMNEKHFAQGWVSTFFCHLYNVVHSYNLNPYLQKPNVFSSILSLNCHVMYYIFRYSIEYLFHLSIPNSIFLFIHIITQRIKTYKQILNWYIMFKTRSYFVSRWIAHKNDCISFLLIMTEVIETIIAFPGSFEIVTYKKIYDEL